MTAKTVIIHPYLKTSSSSDNDNKLEEAIRLAKSIDLDIVKAEAVGLSRIMTGSFIGKGKLEELKGFIEATETKLCVINHEVSPIQQRNMENILGCKVIDRTALILEIFGARARTKEGKLQVELAAQIYQKSRLVRSWTHLERQRGGGGFLGGPGETQIESDRRAISERIVILKRHLQKVVKTRELHRKSRQKIPYSIVALVGYTNAGKSTLFNLLTKAEVLAEDKLFATLDPTMRLVKLPSGREVILSDTVGFISDLPTELVAAFRATLEEVVEADILLHVRDIASADSEQQKEDVYEVLENLSVEEKLQKNTIEVLNKTDQLSTKQQKELKSNFQHRKNYSCISALQRKGVENLLQKIDAMLTQDHHSYHIKVPTKNGKAIAWLHAHGEVLESKHKGETTLMTIKMSEKHYGQYKSL